MLGLRSLARRTAIVSAAGLGLYIVDDKVSAGVARRTFRTVYNGAIIAADYKLNFTSERADEIDKLHERVAQRLLDVCRKNSGLYIKMGQSIGVQSAVLPPAYQRALRTLYDSAPPVDSKSVERIILEDLGKQPEAIFSYFDPIPVATASIAQVHKAQLHDGTWVAVKVQKPEIRKQMDVDILAYKALVRFYEYLFDLPLYWSTEYTERHLREEIDFIHEAHNSETASQNIQAEPDLRDNVYVPRVHWEYVSKRILVADWVDAVQMTDKEALSQIGISGDAVMKTIVDLFSSQIFRSGFVHGDPHPGNVLVRRHPTRKNDYQIVLLDHGLYIRESEKFRQEYCELWKALFLMDTKTIENICKSWGINDSNMFASMTLQRPYSPSKSPEINSASLSEAYEMQVNMKERIKNFLADEDKIPRELLFIGRNMGIVRANNKSMGSPVNRASVAARWAVRGLGEDTWRIHNDNAVAQKAGFSRFYGDISSFVRSQWNYYLFETSLFVINLGFYFTRTVDRVRGVLFGTRSGGFEELLDKQMKEQLKSRFGIEVDERMFDA